MQAIRTIPLLLLVLAVLGCGEKKKVYIGTGSIVPCDPENDSPLDCLSDFSFDQYGLNGELCSCDARWFVLRNQHRTRPIEVTLKVPIYVVNGEFVEDQVAKPVLRPQEARPLFCEQFRQSPDGPCDRKIVDPSVENAMYPDEPLIRFSAELHSPLRDLPSVADCKVACDPKTGSIACLIVDVDRESSAAPLAKATAFVAERLQAGESFTVGQLYGSFAMGEDPCERGQINVSGNRLENVAAIGCLAESDLGFSVTFPPTVEASFTTDGDLTLTFSSPERAPIIDFDNELLQPWGGVVGEVKEAKGVYFITTERCIAVGTTKE